MARHSRSSWPRMMSALVLPGVLILLVALALAGCGRTAIVRSWSPSASPA